MLKTDVFVWVTVNCFGQIWSKKSKLSVLAEIWYLYSNPNMKNSMVVLAFSVLDLEHPFW